MGLVRLSKATRLATSLLAPAGGGGGDVTGPASSVADAIALFSGTTGKFIQDSGVLLDANVVLIQSAADFPAPAAGVITLEAGKTYHISGTVNIGTDRIAWNGAAGMFGTPTQNATLLYGGVGALFTSVGDAVFVSSLLLAAPVGSLFDFTSAGGADSCIMQQCVLVGGLAYGSVAGADFFVMTECQLTGPSVSGFTFTGATNHRFALSFVEVGDTAGAAFDLGASVWDSVQIVNAAGDIGAGDSFLDGAAAGANVNDSAGISGSSFTGAGTPVATITRCDPKWLFMGNVGDLSVSDTAPGITVTMPTNVSESVIVTPGTPAAVVGTFAVESGSDCKFSASAGGTITYDGLIERRTSIVANMKLLMASGGALNRNLTVGIALNGTAIVNSASLIRATTTDYGNVTVIWQIQSLDPADTLQLFVTNETDTANIIASGLKIAVS